jgi:colicin import membrane protein
VKHESDEPEALEKRPQPGRLPAIVLAVAVHGAFFALIVFGVTWQSSPTPPVQAELWDKLPTTKAPAKPQPEPEPPKPQPVKPEPAKPEPPKPQPKDEPRPVKPDPAIAEKAERAKQEKEKREKEKAERLEKQKQDEAAKKKREQEEAAKKKREDEKRRLDEERTRKEAEKAREEASSVRQKAIEGFVAKIKDKIRGRANVPDTVSGKPSVQVRIRILPGGEVLDIAITHPSGNRVYDTAIERAIRSASPLPVPDANSELFPQFRDLILNIEHER